MGFDSFPYSFSSYCPSVLAHVLVDNGLFHVCPFLVYISIDSYCELFQGVDIFDLIVVSWLHRGLVLKFEALVKD